MKQKENEIAEHELEINNALVYLEVFSIDYYPRERQ